MKLLLKFLKELYRWLRFGHQYRSKTRMLEIYSICKECPHFVKDGGWLPEYDKCNLCGCNLHPVKRAVNKIAWNTTSCPDKNPKWVSEAGEDGSKIPF